MNVVAPNGVANVGDRIDYTITVANSGNGTATGISVSDPKIATLSCTIDAVSVTLPTDIAASKSLICTGSYTLTQADINAGSVANTATVTGSNVCKTTDPVCAAPTTTPLTQAPSVALVKTAAAPTTGLGTSTSATDAGDTITYSFVVTNTGNVTLTNVRITSDPNLPSLSCTAVTLAPGASATLTCTGNVYTITQADMNAGQASNTAVASGTPPTGADVTDTSGTATNNNTPTTTPLTQAPSVALVKTAAAPTTGLGTSTSATDAGDTITYSFVVTNTGNVTLTNVRITSDPNLPSLSCTAVTLAPGASATLTCTGNVYTITQADMNAGQASNTAVASGTPPTGADVTDTSGTATNNNTPTTTPLVNPPVANNDSATNGTPGTATTLNVVGNDTDPNNNLDPTTVVMVNPPAGSTLSADGKTLTVPGEGTWSVNPTTGAITFTPVSTFFGDPTPISYTVADTTGLVSNVATVTVDYPQDAPVANNDSATNGTPGTATTLNVVGNDTDPNNNLDPTTVVMVNPPAGSTLSADGKTLTVPGEGTWSVNPTTGAITFTPVSTFFGDPTPISYTVADTTGLVSNVATVTVDYPQDAPVANNDSAVTPQNAPVTTNVLANDSSTGAPLDPTSVTVTTASPNGTTTVNADGTITFTPTPGFSGTTTYTYQVCDTSTPTPVCDTAVVTVTVGANTLTVTDDAASTPQNTPVTTNVLANDSSTGAPLDPTSVTVTTASPNGTTTVNADGTITFTPTPGFSGTTTYTYQVCDTSTPTPVCDTAVVTVTVANAVLAATPDTMGPINGAVGNPNAGNVLTNDTINGQPMTVDTVNLSVTDPADPLTPGAPVPSIDVTTGNVVVPPGTPAGTYPITYQVCDKANPTHCATATATVIVGASVVDAVNDTASIPSTGGVAVPNVLVNDTLNGQPVTLEDVTLTQVSTTNPNVTLDPTTGAVNVAPGTPAGSYTLTYQICEVLNPTNCDTATVTVTVTMAPAVANPDQGSVTVVDGGVAVPNILVNDTLGGQTVTLGQVVITVTSPSSDDGVVLDPATGTVTVAPGTPEGSYQIGYQFCERANPTNCAFSRVVITVTGEVSSMRVTKTATPRDVKVGDLVRYTLVIENMGQNRVADATVIDTPPAGFSYVDGSLTVADADGAGRLVGKNPLSVDNIDIAIGGRATVVYIMRVGAGVRPGAHVNQAKMVDNGVDSSNVASAEVHVVGDPLMDDSLIIGTVFGDRDGDGWQDSAAASSLKVQGGFAPSAYVANSTTVDRGNGPQPEADASSPLLHGIALGDISARQSVADPKANHAIVIRQTLSSLDFTNDFVLTNAQGYTVRMNAAGETTVEKSGEAAKGLNAVQLEVERKVAQVAGGYQVDYIVRNAGIDERGIPGVRIASVEGLLIETDQFGRYHVAGIDGGPTERGRNFILKVDPATLPPGSVFTTDNPQVRRITPGLPVRFDFGIKLPEDEAIGGSREDVEMNLGEVLFEPGSAEVRDRYAPAIEEMARAADRNQGMEVIIAAQGDTELLAFDRAVAVRRALLDKVRPETQANLKVSLRTNPQDPSSTVVGLLDWPMLGTVLFDTNRAEIKPQFQPLIKKIAEYLMEIESKQVSLVGHADPRASDEYNMALGLRRTQAVYEAITSQMPAQVRDKVRVDYVQGKEGQP
ncbi:DUF7507 domain-containing protein [Solilutibacter tolerans]|nr:Ig-like domain-containing protein [Lysobacter tolerans]